MKGRLFINEKRCKGCEICVSFCPKKVLAVNVLGKVEAVRSEECIACGQCELRCPDYAILVEKELAS